MKKNLILALLLFVCIDTNAQKGTKNKKLQIPNDYSFNNLPIKLEPQIGSSLCWAASMKMVIDYIDKPNSVSLYKIVDKLQLKASSLPSKCDSNFSKNTEWNTAIEMNVADTTDVYNIQEFDRIFSNLGYYSIEDSAKLSWKDVKQQIDNGKPIILMVQDGEGEELLTSSHVVVLKGYFEKGREKFVIVNDPWGACEGQSYSIDYNLLINNESGKHIRLLKTIHSIHKKTESWCFNNPKRRSWATDINNPKDLYLMNIYSAKESDIDFSIRLNKIINCISNSNCVDTVTDEIITLIDVNFISNKLLKIDRTNDIENTFQNFKCKDIVFQREGIVVRIQLIDRKWIIVKFMNNFYPKENIKDIKSYIIYPNIYQAFYRFKTNSSDLLKPQYFISNALNPTIQLKTELMFEKIKLISTDTQSFYNTARINRDFNTINFLSEKIKGQIDIPRYNQLLERIKLVRKNN